MANNYGPNVSRVLDPKQTGYKTVIWQANRPPLDAEFNLLGDIAAEWNRIHVLRGTPSGFYGDAINPQDSFVTNPNNSNWFQFGSQYTGEKQSIVWANVNGWLIPVTGTLTGSPPGSPNNTDTWNRITLPPPPSNTGDARIDFVFLEAWLARIPPNPATTNKPAAAAIWRYGNVEGGWSFISDDLQDPAIGIETTQRVQLQYRIRVVPGLVGLANYPAGFDPSLVKGQGAAAATTSFVFENMRKELGDPGLWRAGDGSQNALGTVDGYTYAIPICAVFRRNRVAWDGDPGQNLNGAFDRNPTAVDRTGYKTFTTIPTLAADLSASAMSATLVSSANISLPLTPATPVVVKIGDEFLTYSAITGTTMTIAARGVFGSRAEAHKAGAVVRVMSGRPDGLFADQIAKSDILDLRHTVNPGGFDYNALLKGNLDKLLKGQLKSTWKRSGGGPQGPFVTYQDKVSASPGALGVTKLDAPDGIRQVFGDPITIQPVVIPLRPASSTAPPNQNISTGLGASFTIIGEVVSTANQFNVGDRYIIPRSQFLNSLPGSDSDQATIIADDPAFTTIRFLSETSDLAFSQYDVRQEPNGDLSIEFTGAFSPSSARNNGCFVTVHVIYGAGRGLSRRPDAVHSVAYLSASPEILLQQQGLPSENQPLRVAWQALCSQFRSVGTFKSDGTPIGGRWTFSLFNGALPTTAEAYVDPGSKSVVLTPFRRMTLTGVTLQSFQKSSPTSSQVGAMPSLDLAGNPKWGATDPLNVFRSFAYGTDPSRVVVLPRKIMPGWGAVKAPILYDDVSNFDEGINFVISSPKGTTPGAGVTAYSPVTFTGGSNTFGVFSTRNLSVVPPTPATYNAAATFGGVVYAGMRFFQDTRNLNRVGLEIPPFYGISRLWAVYEAQDYIDNGSAYNASDRERAVGPGTRATNLLRQNFEGETFWIEIDEDGDSTFVLNAEALDLSRSPNPITDFASGHYVIETSIFGFDRDAFNQERDFRLVLTREAPNVSSLTNPVLVLPGAPVTGDEIVINYSRTPYQGDAWGSAMAQSDIGYKPGAMSTASRYQLFTSELDYNSLTKPNQKVLEVLAGISFITTLGTGRYSGDAPTSSNPDVRVPGYEPWTVPETPIDPRPNLVPRALSSSEALLSVGTEYLGCTERLPLGALFRDKDFRGNAIEGPNGDVRQLILGEWAGPSTIAGSLAPVENPEYEIAPVHGASKASGNAGEVVVAVDGESGNYGVLTNYRTNRGGSAYTISGFSGGDLASVLKPSTAINSNILSGLALLVRNVPTSVGANEVSAGQEILMLVITTAKPQTPQVSKNVVQISTSGTAEGYAAADLFRISGHPLTNDSSRTVVDLGSVVLARKSNLA